MGLHHHRLLRDQPHWATCGRRRGRCATWIPQHVQDCPVHLEAGLPSLEVWGARDLCSLPRPIWLEGIALHLHCFLHPPPKRGEDGEVRIRTFVPHHHLLFHRCHLDICWFYLRHRFGTGDFSMVLEVLHQLSSRLESHFCLVCLIQHCGYLHLLGWWSSR